MKKKIRTTRKRLLFVLLAVAMALATLPLTALPAVATTSGDFEYEVLSETDKTCEITDYTGSATALAIPSELDGYTVTSIGDDTFSGCESLTSITIPDGVTRIGDEAFVYCTALTSITIPDSVTSIGGYAFYNTAYYKDATHWENNVLYIGNHLIEAKDTLSGAYTVRAGTKTIAGYAFSDCTALASITIPDSVTSIGRYAFSDCTALESITIPDSVTSIGEDAFCDTAYYNDSTHWENGVLYIGNHLIEAKDTLSGAYTVRAGTKTIADDAFDGCETLARITIPDSVISIGEDAFYGCTALTNITLSDSLTSIGRGVFSYCASLASVTIPDSVTSIGDYAFWGCTALTSVTIPDSVTSISDYAFSDCTALKNITIPNSVTSIGEYAFEDCTALISITIPDSVTSIGEGTFYGCTALTEIKVDTGNPNYTSESGVLFNRNKTELICYPEGKQDSSYTIPNSVMSIGVYAFYDCTALTSITIPNSVTSINQLAFAYCTALTSITIPDSVTSIDYGAFGCTALESVTIPNSVTRIGEYVFYNCTALTSITIPDSVTSIGEDAFYGCTLLTTIYGYTGSYAETYAAKYGYDFVALQKLTDTETGVSVLEGNFGNFAENTVLNVEKLSAEENAITYDITLTVNGETAQPASAVTVKIPVPETIDGAQCKVYRQETDGTYTDMHATYQNGYMVFTTDHFSTYMVTTEELDTPSYTLGDVNGDDKINAVDARFVLQAASGARTFDSTQTAAADVNGDGKVNAVDARWILQVASGARTL